MRTPNFTPQPCRPLTSLHSHEDPSLHSTAMRTPHFTPQPCGPLASLHSHADPHFTPQPCRPLTLLHWSPTTCLDPTMHWSHQVLWTSHQLVLMIIWYSIHQKNVSFSCLLAALVGAQQDTTCNLSLDLPPNCRHAETALELHAFHRLPAAFQASIAQSMSTIATPSPLFTVSPCVGFFLPDVNKHSLPLDTHHSQTTWSPAEQSPSHCTSSSLS